MPPTTCRDRQSLQLFLLGKTPEIISGPIEQHLAECQSCAAAAAETLIIGDDLTETLERGAVTRTVLASRRPRSTSATLDGTDL